MAVVMMMLVMKVVVIGMMKVVLVVIVMMVMVMMLMLWLQESPGVPERDEAAAGHVPLSTQGAEGQSPAHGC